MILGVVESRRFGDPTADSVEFTLAFSVGLSYLSVKLFSIESSFAPATPG